MKDDSNFIGDLHCDEERRFPPRSRLYCLVPIGSGTARVESATSYLARLAVAHCVSNWSMLKCEIAPRLFGPDVNLRNRLSEVLADMGSAFNGENETSKKFIAILSSLTGRDDLDQITMGFCNGFVGRRFLIRIKQAWCVSCLSEWQASGHEIYYPLLWHLQGVKVCFRHCIPLESECSACHSSFHGLTSHSRPGYCPRCGYWLGSAANKTVDPELDLARELPMAQRVSDFLRDGQKILKTASAEMFPGNVAQLLNGHFAGNVAALARFLAVDRYTIFAWKDGVHRPTLLSLAFLSLRINVPIAELLGTRLGASDFSLQTDSDRQSRRRLFASPPKTNMKKMRKLLEEAANGNVTPAPSLNQLAIQLGCNQSTLQRRFPELAKKIKVQHQQYGVIRIEAKSKLFRSIVNSTVMSMHKAGIYPSQYRLRKSLPKFIDMREPVAHQEWKQLLVALNYSDV